MTMSSRIYHKLWIGQTFLCYVAVLCDWKLAARCCELLVEALTNFPTSSHVQTWGAYALYQLTACHSKLPYPCTWPPHFLPLVCVHTNTKEAAQTEGEK